MPRQARWCARFAAERSGRHDRSSVRCAARCSEDPESSCVGRDLGFFALFLHGGEQELVLFVDPGVRAGDGVEFAPHGTKGSRIVQASAARLSARSTPSYARLSVVGRKRRAARSQVFVGVLRSDSSARSTRLAYTLCVALAWLRVSASGKYPSSSSPRVWEVR